MENTENFEITDPVIITPQALQPGDDRDKSNTFTGDGLSGDEEDGEEDNELFEEEDDEDWDTEAYDADEDEDMDPADSGS